MPRIPLILTALLWLFSAASASPEQALSKENEIGTFVDWLFSEGQTFDEIPFADLIEAVSGKTVLPVDLNDPTTATILQVISEKADILIDELNDPRHPIHSVGRINEISGHIEDFLREKLDSADRFRCEFPRTADGKFQRSGYPDLRLIHKASGRIFYIDPKVHAAGSEQSSFRTFYFEPKIETNKILDNASHLILGIAHGGRRADGSWHFLRWRLIDLSTLRVRLKAEFQAGNRDLYREEAVVAESSVSIPTD
ncbi:MAG TPA: hypothetical protein VK041_04225 [Opitutales bacterium]|nr:hypothetical protein [Opitutales bacterium]